MYNGGYMNRRATRKTRLQLRWSKRKIALVAGGATAVLFLFVQLLYPGDRMLPWQKVDGRYASWQQKSELAKKLDNDYAQRTLKLYFGDDAKKPQYTPTLADFGLKVKNHARLEAAKYPWYLRIVPTSIVWAHAVVDVDEPTYKRDDAQLAQYLATQLGGSCQVAPLNATAKIKGGKVAVVAEEKGGTCKEADVKRVLQTLKPRLGQDTTARVAMDAIPAKLAAKDVKPVVDMLNTQLAKPIQVTYDGKTEQIDAKEVTKWLTFSTEGDVFDVRLDASKADGYLQEKFGKALERAAGVSKVTTHDFIEVSRVDGQVGRKLDVAKTLEHLKEYLLAKADSVPAGELAVQPTVQYTRSYSNTDAGLSALMKNYAESHPGTYGVSLIELDGKRRRAAFNDAQKFTTASTYKLYVAYSALKRIESGEYKWSDQIAGGRDLARCFDDMIVKSDNPCAEALVARIGYGPITRDAQTIVSPNTTFLDTQSYKTTAGDLSTFMASLATGQISLNSDSQARFLDALKRNVFRQGIPAGASGAVADKVGFLEGFLHDAAIVYSPSGTYALSVMTDGSSWANIAELTREIEKLRNR